MNKAEEDQLWRDIGNWENTAPAEMLAAGHSISYREDNTPEGCVIRKHPDGHRELVKIEFVKGGTTETVLNANL